MSQESIVLISPRSRDLDKQNSLYQLALAPSKSLRRDMDRQGSAVVFVRFLLEHQDMRRPLSVARQIVLAESQEIPLETSSTRWFDEADSSRTLAPGRAEGNPCKSSQ